MNIFEQINAFNARINKPNYNPNKRNAMLGDLKAQKGVSMRNSVAAMSNPGFLRFGKMFEEK